MAGHTPRKLPQQKRSREMVDRILDACGDILIDLGYDSVSTHRIAADAGISPGSLYQYFPNKDAIVAMTVERMIGKIASELLPILEVEPGASPESQIRTVVTAALDATERNRGVVRVLVEQMPRLGGSNAIGLVETRASELAAHYWAAWSDSIDVEDPPPMVWIAFQTLQQLTIRYVLDQPDIEREVFIAELTRLLQAYAGSVIGPDGIG